MTTPKAGLAAILTIAVAFGSSGCGGGGGTFPGSITSSPAQPQTVAAAQPQATKNAPSTNDCPPADSAMPGHGRFAPIKNDTGCNTNVGPDGMGGGFPIDDPFDGYTAPPATCVDTATCNPDCPGQYQDTCTSGHPDWYIGGVVCYTACDTLGARNGGKQIATGTPATGLTCDNSPLALGTSNLAPVSDPTLSSSQTTVVNIFGIMPNSENQGPDLGWIYTTANGDMYIGYNPAAGGSAFATFLGNALSGVPIAGGTLQGLINSLVANNAANTMLISAAQYQAIRNQIKKDNQSLNGGGEVLHYCFSHKLATA